MNRRLKMKQVRAAYIHICEIKPVLWGHQRSDPFYIGAFGRFRIGFVTNFHKREWLKYKKAIIAHRHIPFRVSFTALDACDHLVNDHYGLHVVDERNKPCLIPASFWEMVNKI